MDEFELKPLTAAGIPGAIDKAKQYRLLNEPAAAESICRDVLLVDPEHLEGRILLLLALTDLFQRGIQGRCKEALQLAQSLPDAYSRSYYAGIVCERRAKAHHRSGTPAAGALGYEWTRRAMEHFAAAEHVRPAGEDESILRWNACVRRLREHPDLRPGPVESGTPPLQGD